MTPDKFRTFYCDLLAQSRMERSVTLAYLSDADITWLYNNCLHDRNNPGDRVFDLIFSLDSPRDPISVAACLEDIKAVIVARSVS